MAMGAIFVWELPRWKREIREKFLMPVVLYILSLRRNAQLESLLRKWRGPL